MSVEEDFSGGHEIDSSGRVGGSGSSSAEVKPIVVSSSGGEIDLALKSPEEFFNGVIEVKAEFVVGSISKNKGFRSLELSLVN